MALALSEADFIRLVILFIAMFVVVADLAIVFKLWQHGEVHILVPSWAVRLNLLGQAAFLGALSYALIRLIGTPVGEPISLLSIFATFGLAMKLAGLVWMLFDPKARAVDEEELHTEPPWDGQERRHDVHP